MCICVCIYIYIYRERDIQLYRRAKPRCRESRKNWFQGSPIRRSGSVGAHRTLERCANRLRLAASRYHSQERADSPLRRPKAPTGKAAGVPRPPTQRRF